MSYSKVQNWPIIILSEDNDDVMTRSASQLDRLVTDFLWCGSKKSRKIILKMFLFMIITVVIILQHHYYTFSIMIMIIILFIFISIVFIS